MLPIRQDFVAGNRLQVSQARLAFPNEAAKPTQVGLDSTLCRAKASARVALVVYSGMQPQPDAATTIPGLAPDATRERWSGKKPADISPEESARAAAAGYEPGPDGYYVGRDPRCMTHVELEAMGHRPMSPITAIRTKCLDCCAGSPNEVRLCVAIACPNWTPHGGQSVAGAGFRSAPGSGP